MAQQNQGNSGSKLKLSRHFLLEDFLQNELERNFEWSIQYFKLFDRILNEKKFVMKTRSRSKTVTSYEKDGMKLDINITPIIINKLPTRLCIIIFAKFVDYGQKSLVKKFFFEKGKNISVKKDLHCFLNHCIKEYKICCSKSIIES